GTVPHNVPEPAPVIDPGLSGFLNGYQDALANGTARRVGEGTIDGRPVIWLEMHLALPRPPGADQTPDPIEQRGAIDSESYRPIGPSFAYGWPTPDNLYPVPPEGSVRVGGPFYWGYLQRDGVYVKITSSFGEETTLAAARALEPVP